MNNNLTYIKTRNEDLELVYLIKKDGLKLYVEQIWGWEENFQRKIHKENFDPEKITIIKLENEVIGYIIKCISDREIYIENLIIRNKYQNNGFGTEIVNSVIKKSLIEKKSIGLRVLKINKNAKRFYENLGFKKMSESKYHYELKKLHKYDY